MRSAYRNPTTKKPCRAEKPCKVVFIWPIGIPGLAALGSIPLLGNLLLIHLYRRAADPAKFVVRVGGLEISVAQADVELNLGVVVFFQDLVPLLARFRPAVGDVAHWNVVFVVDEDLGELELEPAVVDGVRNL